MITGKIRFQNRCRKKIIWAMAELKYNCQIHNVRIYQQRLVRIEEVKYLT